MTKAGPLFLALMLFATMGMYGCTQQKNGAFTAKIREMENRYTKLEEDYKAVVASAETTRKKLAQSEQQRADLAKQVEELQQAVAERDELRKQLAARTGERDAVQGQLVQFGRDLQALAGRIEAAVNANGGPSLTIITPASRQAQ